MRMIRLLAIYTWRSILQCLGWRSFLITLVVNQTVTPLLGLAVWSVALPNNTSISTYYVALLVVQLMTVSYEQHTFSNSIYDGAVSHDLLKPHPVIVTTLGDNLAIRIWHLLVGLPIIVIAALVADVSFDPRYVIVALPAIVLAAMLRFLAIYVLALSAFWTQRAHGIVGFGETLIFLLGGAAAPIALFPAALRPLGEALPFRAMLGFPAELAAGGLDWPKILQGYGWQCGWIAVFALVAIQVWRSGVRRYTAVGG
jgi:ABC-2 type transport system permease protein